jgi:hypothetical protein
MGAWSCDRLIAQQKMMKTEKEIEKRERKGIVREEGKGERNSEKAPATRDVDPVGEERGVAVASAADARLEALLLHLRDAMRRGPRRHRLRRDAAHQLPQRATRGPSPLYRPPRDHGASMCSPRADPAFIEFVVAIDVLSSTSRDF